MKRNWTRTLGTFGPALAVVGIFASTIGLVKGLDIYNAHRNAQRREELSLTRNVVEEAMDISRGEDGTQDITEARELLGAMGVGSYVNPGNSVELRALNTGKGNQIGVYKWAGDNFEFYLGDVDRSVVSNYIENHR